MWTIIIEHPDHATRCLSVSVLPCRIGRASRCEVSLPGWRVAKRHAEIREVAGGLQLEDAGSLTGTLVNGHRIDRFGPLTPADEIDIGGFRLVVRASDARTPAATSIPEGLQAFPPVSIGRPALVPVQVPLPVPVPVSTHTPAAERFSPSIDPSRFSPQPADPFPNFAVASSPTLMPPSQPAGSPPSAVAQPSHLQVPQPGLPLPHRAASIQHAHRAGSAAGVSTSELMHSWSARLQRETLRALDLRRHDLSHLSDEVLRVQVSDLVRQLIAGIDNLPHELDAELLVREVVDAALGLGPLDLLLKDASISEIMVNGPDEVWLERQGRLQRSAFSFHGEAELRRVLDRIVTPLGRRIDEGSPMVDARLADGSRVNAILAPLSLRGSALTIRRFTRTLMSVSDLVSRGSASPQMLDFLKVCVASRRNIIISGGTGSGKTTLLNLLSNLIPEGERVITIEDSAELSLQGTHVVSLEARPPNLEQRGEVTIRDLVRNALRMRPDRIVVGECRGAEALDMLQAMNTGHDGSLTTLHANSARDVTSRLEVLCLMAGMDLPVQALREQIASAIDLIVHQARFADGVRRITTIAEVTGIESGRVQMQTIFDYQSDLGFTACDVVPNFYEELTRGGAVLDLSVFDSQGRR